MNKKKLSLLIILLIIVLSSNVFASSIKLNINGDLINIPSNMGVPFNKNGRILVPIRFITENLGFEVIWDQEKMEAFIEKDDLKVTLPTNGNNPIVNGTEVQLDIKPLVKNDRTYVPIRFIAELTGKFVNYSNNTVYISDDNIFISDKPLSYESKNIKVNGRNIRANIVTIDTNDSRLRVEMALANDKKSSSETFNSIISRKKPKVAVNGFYFDSYSGANTTYGHLVENYNILNFEGMQPAFFVDRKGTAYIGNPNIIGVDSKDIKHMVSLAPYILQDSKNLAKSGGDMSAGQGYSRAQRTALGMTTDKKLKIVTANGLSASDMAELMIKIGCTDAGHLDGGASSALYYNGKVITRPGRKLNNFVLFYLN